MSFYPAEIFYDGDCPLCRREANYLRTRDKQNKLHFINISDPAFNPRQYQLDPIRVHEVMHARTADGQVYTELAAFRIIWRAMPRFSISGLLLLIFSLPGMNFLGGIGYRWFARNRYSLTGRCKEGVCGIKTR